MDRIPVEESEKQLPTKAEQLLEATKMADWLVPYLYGVDIEQGLISTVAQDRLTRLVGEHESVTQFEYLKTIVAALPSEYRSNAVLYVSGYPEDALQALGDVNMGTTQALLYESGKEYQSEDEQQEAPKYTALTPERIHRGRPERDYRTELETQGLNREIARRRLSAYVLSSPNTSKKARGNGVVRFTDWYDGDLSVNEYARKERLSINGFQSLIKRLSGIALDASLDDVTQTDQDMVAAAAKEIEETKAAKKEVVKKPSLKVVSEQYENPVVRRRSEDDEDDNPLSWQSDSLCAQVDPEAFFPEKGGSTRAAKKICANCDVRGQCLEYALENEEHFGIWGGKSERERRKLLKTQNKN